MNCPHCDKDISEALSTSQRETEIKALEEVLDIPGKYIDDGAMVYWSDFSADTLEKIIRERIAALTDSKGVQDG